MAPPGRWFGWGYPGHGCGYPGRLPARFKTSAVRRLLARPRSRSSRLQPSPLRACAAPARGSAEAGPPRLRRAPSLRLCRGQEDDGVDELVIGLLDVRLAFLL